MLINIQAKRRRMVDGAHVPEPDGLTIPPADQSQEKLGEAEREIDPELRMRIDQFKEAHASLLKLTQKIRPVSDGQGDPNLRALPDKIDHSFEVSYEDPKKTLDWATEVMHQIYKEYEQEIQDIANSNQKVTDFFKQ